MVPVAVGTDADVIVFNTCAVRENADNKLYGNLSHLANLKETRPNMQIAVGGCMAQKDKETIIKRAPYVDVVFGTHNVGSLPILLERARIEKQAQVEIKEALKQLESDVELFDQELTQLLLTIPNAPSMEVPKGKTPEEVKEAEGTFKNPVLNKKVKYK